MPSTEKLTKHLKATLGTLLVLESIASFAIIALCGFSSSCLMTLVLLWISISFTAWAYRGTKTKNVRLLNMYIASNCGFFITFVASLLVLTILVAISGPQSYDSVTSTFPEDPSGVASGEVPVLTLVAPEEATFEYETTSTLQETLTAYRHNRHEVAATHAAIMWTTISLFIGWFLLKILSIILAWKLKNAYQGLPCCCGRKKQAPAREMAPVAYASTPYYIVVPQEATQYVAPKFAV